MKNSAIMAGIIYALLLLVGGLIGFLKAGSLISLITSFCSVAVLLVAMVLALRGNPFGIRLASLVALFYLLFFTYRWWLTTFFFPSGMMATISLIALFCFLCAYTPKRERG